MHIEILYKSGEKEVINVPKANVDIEIKNEIIRLAEEVFSKSEGAGYFTSTIGNETTIVNLGDVSHLKIIGGNAE